MTDEHVGEVLTRSLLRAPLGVGRTGLDSSALQQRQVSGFCEYGDEYFRVVKAEHFMSSQKAIKYSKGDCCVGLHATAHNYLF
jgi:hypothetical protein